MNNSSRFQQQRLSACRPFLTPISSLIIFAIFFLGSITLGLIYRSESDQLFEYIIPYSDRCQINESCQIFFELPHSIDGPLFFIIISQIFIRIIFFIHLQDHSDNYSEIQLLLMEIFQVAVLSLQLMDLTI